ncbi:hypothetical protein CONPUDRAFT_35897, partial [Coniophora puteana RWD-64-598 SS2]
RLSYIRHHQQRVLEEDAALMGEDTVADTDNIYLPASFLGSRAWSSNQIADSLAVAGALGNPTFFITMTCNSCWPEIQDRLRPGQTYVDIPLVVVRVFKRKLACLLQCLRSLFPNVGRPVYIIHSIEFQKRGLPHAHILVRYDTDCVL